MSGRSARLSLSVQYAVAGDDLPSRNLLRRWAAAALANDAIVTLRFVDTAEGETLAAHCAHLVVHGMLHLQGYDHRRAGEAARMEAREVAILAALGVANPYAARGTSPAQAARGPTP